jgi:hypothetical protein
MLVCLFFFLQRARRAGAKREVGREREACLLLTPSHRGAPMMLLSP